MEPATTTGHRSQVATCWKPKHTGNEGADDARQVGGGVGIRCFRMRARQHGILPDRGSSSTGARARPHRGRDRRDLQSPADQQLDARSRGRPARGHLHPLRRGDCPQRQRPGRDARAAGDHPGRHRQREGSALPQGHRRCHHQRRRARLLQEHRAHPQHREAHQLCVRDGDLRGAPGGAAGDQLRQGPAGQEGEPRRQGRGAVHNRTDRVQAPGRDAGVRLHQQCPRAGTDENGRDRRHRQQRRQASRPAHQVQERRQLQVPADPDRPLRRVLHSRHADGPGLSGFHQAGRESRDAGRADGARRLQLGARERPLPARAALHRALLRPVREAARPSVSSEVEERESCRQRAGVDQVQRGGREAEADGGGETAGADRERRRPASSGRSAWAAPAILRTRRSCSSSFSSGARSKATSNARVRAKRAFGEEPS